MMSALTYSEFAERFNIGATIHDLQRPGAEYQGFGYAAASLGDINNDGFGDFAVSAPGSEFGTENPVAGAVFIFSGQDGSLVRTLTDGSAGFGFSLAALGDVNNDGVPDLLIGSPQYDLDDNGVAERHGQAYVYSGATGMAFRTYGGSHAGDELGYAVARLADITGDGIDEFAIGEPGAGVDSEGIATIYSGANGAVVYMYDGEGAGHRFGSSIIGVGDIGPAAGEPGNGIEDFLIGAPGSESTPDFAGRIYLFNGGMGGTLRWALSGENAGDRFGSTLGAVFPRANEAQFYVGAPGADPTVGGASVADAGAVYRVGQDGVLEDSIDGIVEGGARGTWVRMIGDVDGDGVGDLAIVSPGEAMQRSRIFSGLAGHEVTLPAGAMELLRHGIFGVGDVNNDGISDLAGSFEAGDRFVIVSSLAVVPPSSIAVVSDNQAYMFTGEGSARRIAVINGELMSFERVAGLAAGDTVLGVNNDGLIVVRDAGAGNIYLVRDGVRTLLQDALAGVPTDPAPNYATFQLVRVGNGGHVLFMDTDDSSDEGVVTRSWILRGDTLTYLWNGEVRDVNARGTVLGVRPTDDGPVVVLLDADGNLTPVGLADAWRLNDDTLVVGVDGDGNLAVWRDGDVSVIGDVALPEGAPSREWIVRGVNNNGQVLATFRTVSDGAMPVITDTDYLYDPEDGLTRLLDVTFDVDAGESPGNDAALFLASDGTVVTRDGVLTPVSDDAPWVGAQGTPLWTSNSGDMRVIAGVNQFGDVVVLRRDGDAWRGSRLDIAGLAQLESFNVVSVLTHTDSQLVTHVFVVSDQGTYLALVRGDHTARVPAERLDTDDTHITGNATVFESADGRIHLAGTMDNGDLVLYWQPEAGTPGNFFFANLTAEHVEQQGGAFTPVASNLTTIITSWGASHLFYLSENGALHSVWIAPGMAYWVATNISQNLMQGSIDSNPELALAGEITAYDTDWDGLNIVGQGVDGNPTAIWWVPQFGGQWSLDPLYGLEGQPDVPFNPASSTSYTTSWGGLNVATVQESGEIGVFWWVPGFDLWRGETLTIGDRPEGLTFGGDITASVVGDELNLFVQGSDGDLYRIFWMPGFENVWQYENITEGVA